MWEKKGKKEIEREGLNSNCDDDSKIYSDKRCEETNQPTSQPEREKNCGELENVPFKDSLRSITLEER